MSLHGARHNPKPPTTKSNWRLNLMQSKPPKPKKCDTRKGGCGAKYVPARSFQCWCSPECGVTISRLLAAKKQARKALQDRKETREKLLANMSKAKIAKTVEKAVNAYIRLRDAGNPCISCASLTSEIYQAGHFLSVGARPELRFNLDNIHLQCVQCNKHKGGNHSEYRPRLILKIGIERVLALEGPHPINHWTRDELMEIRRNAQQLTSELKASAKD